MIKIFYHMILLIFLTFGISSSLFSQSRIQTLELMTRIGKNNLNELNLGIAYTSKNNNEIEFLFGYELGTDYLLYRCHPLGPREYAYVRTKIKGVNLRTTYYGFEDKRIGISNLLRYGNANDLNIQHCWGSKEREEFDQELLDLGLLGIFRPKTDVKFVRFTFGLGFLIRTSKISNYRLHTELSQFPLYRLDRTTTTYRILIEYGVQINLPIKKIKNNKVSNEL